LNFSHTVPVFFGDCTYRMRFACNPTFIFTFPRISTLLWKHCRSILWCSLVFFAESYCKGIKKPLGTLSQRVLA
jgi:hypothetical protein